MTAHKQVLFRSAAREKILRGTAQLADAVRVTLGPRSKSVLMERKWGPPIVCNDGVTIAKELSLKDPEENLGAQMLRQAAEKTGDLVGDPAHLAGEHVKALASADSERQATSSPTAPGEAGNRRTPLPSRHMHEQAARPLISAGRDSTT
jgi:hypothetical protein